MALFDSVILIDYLNNVPQAVAVVDEAIDPVISVVTLAEVMAGVEEESYHDALTFLKTFPILPVDEAIAEEAARLRRTYRWRLPDAFQAAIAISHGTKLVTRNTRDFKAEHHLFVMLPYTL
jgi:hypothetical protein